MFIGDERQTNFPALYELRPEPVFTRTMVHESGENQWFKTETRGRSTCTTVLAKNSRLWRPNTNSALFPTIQAES
jgi:hypothetical protein